MRRPRSCAGNSARSSTTPRIPSTRATPRPAHVKVEGADEPLTSQAPQPGPPSKAAPALAIPSPAVPQALRGIAPDVLVFDLSSLTYLQMRQMLGAVRRRAAAEPGPLPVIIENHTKYLGDMRPVEKFCEHLAASDDVKVLTARELARNLQQGLYRVRTRNSLGVSRSSLRAALAERPGVGTRAIGRHDDGGHFTIPADTGAEEALRRFIVQVFAKAARGTRDRRHPRGDAQLHGALVEPARGMDWRYLWTRGTTPSRFSTGSDWASRTCRGRAGFSRPMRSCSNTRIASLQTAASVREAGA